MPEGQRHPWSGGDRLPLGRASGLIRRILRDVKVVLAGRRRGLRPRVSKVFGEAGIEDLLRRGGYDGVAALGRGRGRGVPRSGVGVRNARAPLRGDRRHGVRGLGGLPGRCLLDAGREREGARGLAAVDAAITDHVVRWVVPFRDAVLEREVEPPLLADVERGLALILEASHVLVGGGGMRTKRRGQSVRPHGPRGEGCPPVCP